MFTRGKNGYNEAYMDIHPILVHFPIGLLVVYSIFECVRVRRLEEAEWWLMTKAAILFTGFLGALAALWTGETAASLAGGETPLIELHSSFAGAAVATYGVLVAHYLVSLARRFSFHARLEGVPRAIASFAYAANDLVFKPWLVVILAFLGFALMGVTGALGGALVYGPNADFIVSFVYHIFFK